MLVKTYFSIFEKRLQNLKKLQKDVSAWKIVTIPKFQTKNKASILLYQASFRPMKLEVHDCTIQLNMGLNSPTFYVQLLCQFIQAPFIGVWMA